MPHILTPAVMKKLESLVKDAERAARRDPIFSARVAAVRLVHDYGQANLDMMAALNNLRFDEAKRHHDLVLKLQGEAIKHSPPLLYPHTSVAYLRRFWSPVVETGFERTTGGNEPVAALPDQWHFMLDPLHGGEALGFWKAGVGTASWLPLRTRSLSWGDQGLRYYKGACWYRTTIEVPARFRDRRIFLWLGGIDDSATAWINGRKLPLREIGKTKDGKPILAIGDAPIGPPWEFDATGTVRPGETNEVVVMVSNRQVDELGTGGITGPAMLWAEAESGK
jgi:hypothetical protein